jgi:hypothetical protein
MHTLLYALIVTLSLLGFAKTGSLVDPDGLNTPDSGDTGLSVDPDGTP